MALLPPHKWLTVGSNPTGSTKPKFKKGSKIERVYKLYKMGLSRAQIIEITGFNPKTVHGYLWRFRYPDKFAQVAKKQQAKRKAPYWKAYYQKHKEVLRARANNAYHEKYKWIGAQRRADARKQRIQMREMR